ncbi:MAG TPA: hypothetical protein VE992_06485 [Solirubrobacteraceae bacterium]|nr:hypothetical protein [Solirubrobacteraceae bacterium]
MDKALKSRPGPLRRWPLAGAAIVALAMAFPSLSQAAAPATCTGSPQSPGTLAGSYAGNVSVSGVCFVNGGVADIAGNLTLEPGSALVAAFARNDVTGQGESALHVAGNIRVARGATLLLGCTPRSFPCLDDPSHDHPTLSSAGRVGGSLLERAPLGVIVHQTSIAGNVVEDGGGGGVTCDPSGIFAAFGSPVYSDYEDSTVGGSLRIVDLRSCWLGVARVDIARSARFIRNRLQDPDAIEIIDNRIGGDLACTGNSMVWDSADISPTGALFPRQPEPNTVAGARLGQCVLASPATDGGSPGPGPF